MSGLRRTVQAAAPILVLLAAVGCSGGDPAEAVLKMRRQWKVDPVGFVVREDGSVSAQFRLNGPANNTLDAITVKIDLLDGAGNSLHGSWETFDLREVKRGGPAERFVTIPGPAGDGVVESIRVDPVHDPAPGDYRRIRELAGLESPAG